MVSQGVAQSLQYQLLVSLQRSRKELTRLESCLEEALGQNKSPSPASIKKLLDLSVQVGSISSTIFYPKA
jgi:hypothetical protein